MSLRLILASKLVDRTYFRFNRLRELAVVTFASDSALANFNDRIYRESARYLPDTAGFVSGLYPWEEQAIAEYFPPPPAHVLVGGAGSGREPFALSDLGYRVTAFEPVSFLVDAMEKQSRAQGRTTLDCYVGGYEELPFVKSPVDAAKRSLGELGPFDAAIFGWGSFSHICDARQRHNTLRNFGDLSNGPILISFTSTRDEGIVPTSVMRRRLLTQKHRHPADRFSMTMGFQHPVSEREMIDLASGASLSVLKIDFSHTSLAPHAVLKRS